VTRYRCHAYVDAFTNTPEEAAEILGSLLDGITYVYVGRPEPSPCASRLVQRYRQGEDGWELAP
jgi:hypothetical protein